MGGGEPRGRAHGAGAARDDVPASRHNAFLFRVGLVPSRPIPAHCSRRSLPGCRGNFGALVGVLFLAGSGSYSLLACVQAASAPGFPANPDCVPSAGLWRVDVRCCSASSGTGVPSIMAYAGEAERRQCVGGQCQVDRGVQSHLHPTGAFLSCSLSAHAQRPDVMSRTRRGPARGCETADASSKFFLRQRQLLGARTVRPKPSRGC